jgi:hypothetical protein
MRGVAKRSNNGRVIGVLQRRLASETMQRPFEMKLIKQHDEYTKTLTEKMKKGSSLSHMSPWSKRVWCPTSQEDDEDEDEDDEEVMMLLRLGIGFAHTKSSSSSSAAAASFKMSPWTHTRQAMD